MAIMLFSVVMSLVSASLLWLVIGSKLPLGAVDKFPAINNIAYYALMFLVPVYLLVFFLFS